MYKNIRTNPLVLYAIFAVLSSSVNGQPTVRPLNLAAPSGFPIIPLLEGWIANADGSRTFSFGFVNRNEEQAVDIPLGENNYLEPAEFNGMQPSHFQTGRHRGVFTVTVPPDQADISVWWHIVTDEHQEMKIPGRARESAYELDFIRPRPQGSLQPMAGFGENGAKAVGLTALVAALNQPVKVGTPVTLVVNASDPSQRDPADPRFVEPIPVTLHWFKHQGPGDVEFSRHASSVSAESETDEDDEELSSATAANTVQLTDGYGVGRVLASFSQPGEYLIRTLVENYRAPDSSPGNQCCWTNLYQRITVTP